MTVSLLSKMYHYIVKKCNKELRQYDRPRLFGCEPVDGELGVLSSNQIHIATFVHQMGHMCVSHLV